MTMPPAQRRELTESLQRGTLRLTRLIDNLLESVRIESGQLAIRHQSVDLAEVIEDARALIGSLLALRRQQLEISLPEELPLIEGDKHRLTQVFVNLLANANKFAPEGSTVRIGCERRRRPAGGLGGGRGPGTGLARPARDSSRRSSRGCRAGAGARRTRDSGSGSCAPSSSGTAARSAWSAREEGRTRFTMTLPVRGDRLKILVADDDRDLRDLVGFTLTQAGYLVIKAPDGSAALRAVADEAPDLVILDINMPGASGFQVCESIRRNSRVPIMMLTVRGEEEDLVRALDLGADDYLTKPFSPRTLLARAKALLRRAGTESASVLAAGKLTLDTEEHTVRIGERTPCGSPSWSCVCCRCCSPVPGVR